MVEVTWPAVLSKFMFWDCKVLQEWNKTKRERERSQHILISFRLLFVLQCQSRWCATLGSFPETKRKKEREREMEATEAGTHPTESLSVSRRQSSLSSPSVSMRLSLLCIYLLIVPTQQWGETPSIVRSNLHHRLPTEHLMTIWQAYG